MKKAFITGISGQDGSFLAELLVEKGYEVWGLVRRSSYGQIPNLDDIRDSIYLVPGDITDHASIAGHLCDICPDEIYNLAAQSVPRDSWKYPLHTLQTTALGSACVFEAAKAHCPNAKIYHASSSEIFGDAKSGRVDEGTPIMANNTYGAAKAAAHLLARVYRQSYDMHISCGILFNHESTRRSPDFVTRKVSLGAATISLGEAAKVARNEDYQPIIDSRGKLCLGSLQAQRDWGYARDYVRAMWMMVQQPNPDDYIIATGKLNTVQSLCEIAFSYLGLDWQDYVESDSQFMRLTEIAAMYGDYSKAESTFGWRPTISFENLVHEMIDSDLHFLQG